MKMMVCVIIWSVNIYLVGFLFYNGWLYIWYNLFGWKNDWNFLKN